MMEVNDKLDLILEILRQHDKRFDQIDKRFEDVDRRFEDVDRRFEEVNKRLDYIDRRLDRIEDSQRDEKKRIDEVYESREKVKITFGWQWAGLSFFIAVLSASIVGIFA